MFNKPQFNATNAGGGFGGFNSSATASPFQSAFNKPTTSTFGAAPTFGAQQTTPSLFGTQAQPAQATGLFGATNTSTAFGGTTTAAQPAFGFAAQQQQQNNSIFGAQPTTNQASSLFGQQPTTSAFGSAIKPAGLGGFGQTSNAGTTLFGQQQPAVTSTSGFGAFGQTNTAGSSNLFGSNQASAFGQPAAAAGVNAGTSLAKYNPIIGTDTLMKGGQPNNINTKQHCISAMKEYEGKSLEELRMEDYLANRKGPQAGTSGAGFFGSSATTTGAGTGLFGSTQQTNTLFGQPAAGTTENKGLFGTSTFGQAAQPSAFGTTNPQNNFLAKPFGAANTGFGSTSTDASNPFGAKPAFGQTAGTGLFGQSTATSTAPAFGQTNTGFGGFGSTQTTQQQQPTLFGAASADANKSAFGLGNTSTANTGFGGFGTTATNTAGGGLFGNKPATGFGAAPAFGQTSTANTGFSNFSLGGNTNAGGLFNSTANKTAPSAFGGFGTQNTTAPLNFNTGNAASGGLFGNNAAKPGGLFGGSLGGSTNTGGLFGGTAAGGFGVGNSLGGGFGSNTLGSNTSMLGGVGSLGSMQQQQQSVPIHQQILSKVTSPYGDNPIYKDLKRDENDATRATNPAAQQALLDSNSSQFKISVKPSPSSIKVKPVGSALTKKSLFDGLEEFDSSVETFTLKPSAKRLIIKSKANGIVNGVNGSGSATNLSSSNNTPRRDAALLVSNSSTGAQNAENAATTSAAAATAANTITTTAIINTSQAAVILPAAASTDNDNGRRESWLHPNNLEKVRQQNLNVGNDAASSPLNSTLSELVPRKPLETYRPLATTGSGGSGAAAAGVGRLSISTVYENPFEDQTNNSFSRREISGAAETVANESQFASRSFGSDWMPERSLPVEEAEGDYEEHPTGITLRRVGYYTIPTLEDLKSFLAEDGSCIVPYFTIGREGYGNVYFGKEMDVAGLNLDEIVHFRNKEIIIYPDDDNKPAIGSGLNREAQVTLDQVWPLDKTKHEPIKDAQRLAEMDWEGKLRRVCDKNETRFIEYRPETGSWVFRVKHFSKYGLNDSDEEDDALPTDAKKAKMLLGPDGKPLSQQDKISLQSLQSAQKISEDAARALDAKSITQTYHNHMDESAEFMLMDKNQFYQNNNNNEYSLFADQQAARNNDFNMISLTTAMAKNAGTDAHKLQLMKASFFMNDEVDRKSVASELDAQDFNSNFKRQENMFNERSRLDLYSTSLQNMWKNAELTAAGDCSEASSQIDFGSNGSPSLPASSAVSVISLLHGDQTETSSAAPGSESTTAAAPTATKLPALIVKPKVATIKSLAAIAPFSKSLAYSLKDQYPADMGLYHSRRFKVCFGSQNTLVVPTTRHNISRDIQNEDMHLAAENIFKPRADNDYSAMILQIVKVNSTMQHKNFTQSIVDHLQIQLHNSLQQDVEGSDCPWIQANNGTELIVKHLDEAVKQINLGAFEEYAVSVWSLCLALWGDHEELEGSTPTSHFAVMCRRNLLSEWLENTLTNKDLLTKTVSKHTYLDYMLELIMCHKVNEACDLAFRYDDGNLALLLSQLSSGPTVRKLMEDQLAAWHASEADTFIQLERLKLFMLIAGVSLMNSAHGPLNTLEGIEWIKVLAIQLWYLCSPTASITDALLAYEKSFQSEEFYSLPPTPCYDYKFTTNTRHELYDLRYHLLQLFSKRSHPLERLLNPATHTADPMDFRLSWLLLQTLEALGYAHCSELCACQLHVSFAAQLENNDLWHWSIFVLLHIKDKNQREIAVQDLLYRYVSVSKDVALSEKEKFVINNLGVPEKWIDYAKAVKAGAIGNAHLQAKYLLKAKQWSMAHEVIFQHIAPDAVINDNLDYLQQLLSQFEAAEVNSSVKVPEWSNKGQIFLDFIDITEKFKSLKSLQNEADIETQWESLKPQLGDLCSRINLLPCPTAKHRLCQSEIAQNLACLVRGVLLVCPVLNPCLIIQMALERLPLPQEFAQKELRDLFDTLISDLAKVNVVATDNNSDVLMSIK